MLEQLTDPKPFKILNASAGSGKTYNLVRVHQTAYFRRTPFDSICSNHCYDVYQHGFVGNEK